MDKNSFKRFIIGLVLCVALGIGTIVPLFSSGYFPMHDDTQVGRVSVMGRALLEGQFPVRWVDDLGYGYGYPIFNFYGPLPYYIGGLFYVFGASGLVSAKIMMAIGMLLSGVTMFILMNKRTTLLMAILASVFYQYAPYHAVELYVRGAVGELWAYAFLPLIAYGFLEVYEKITFRSVIITASSIAMVVISHTLFGYIVVLSIGIASIILFVIERVRGVMGSRAMRVWLSLVIGLMLSSFFWLPAAVEMRYTSVSSQVSETADYRDHFVCPQQLWSSPWGFGGSALGCNDGMSFKLGKIHVIWASIACCIFLFSKKRYTTVFVSAVAIFVGSIFLMTPASSAVWNRVVNMSYIQYPWRFLSFASFGISIIASYVSYVRNKMLGISIMVIGVFLCIFVNYELFAPQYLFRRADSEFETEEELRFRVSKISDEYLPPGIGRPKTKEDVPKSLLISPDSVLWSHLSSAATTKNIQVSSNIDTEITLNIADFPGWTYRIDGKPVLPTIRDGKPAMRIARGDHTVEARFINTAVRMYANFVTALTLGIIGVIYGYKRYKTIG